MDVSCDSARCFGEDRAGAAMGDQSVTNEDLNSGYKKSYGVKLQV